MVEGRGIASPRASAEALRKFLRSKTADPGVVSAVLFLSLVCFLFCFLYTDYGLESVGRERFRGIFWLRHGEEKLMVEIGKEGPMVEESECDLFDGKWVWDDGYPLYEAKDCSFLDKGFRCEENGRPDDFYTKWRWQPAHCNLPRFISLSFSLCVHLP